MTMKLSEKILLILTVTAAAGAAGYVYVVEPALKKDARSGMAASRYETCVDLIKRRDHINKRAGELFTAATWKNSAEEQQIVFQTYVEKQARSATGVQIKSIYPLPLNKAKRYDEIALQMELETSSDGLARLLSSIGTATMPLKVRKLNVYGITDQPGMIRVLIELSSLWISVP